MSTTPQPQDVRADIIEKLDEWSFLPGVTHEEDCEYWDIDNPEMYKSCNCSHKREFEAWPECLDEILRLCEAAALAAAPEKKSMHNMLDTKTAMPSEVIGHNQAVATYQANIHSVFGGTHG